MNSRDPIKDFFSFLLGAVLLSMGAFLFFNQVMVSSQSIDLGRGLRFGQGFRRAWGGGYGSGFGGSGFGLPQGLGDSFGLLLIPLVIGVCLLFALRNQRWGWFLVLASVAALAVGVTANADHAVPAHHALEPAHDDGPDRQRRRPDVPFPPRIRR
jgi:hypothetical protein